MHAFLDTPFEHLHWTSQDIADAVPPRPRDFAHPGFLALRKKLSELIGADSLHYLSLDGMLSALGKLPESYCTACFTGDYPAPLEDPPVDKRPSGRWVVREAGDSSLIIDAKVNVRRGSTGKFPKSN